MPRNPAESNISVEKQTLVRHCEVHVKRHGWEYLSPEDLADKVLAATSDESKWQYFIGREYFNFLCQLLTNPRTPEQTSAGAWTELDTYIRRRSATMARKRDLDANDAEEIAQRAMYVIFLKLDTVVDSFIGFCQGKILQAITDVIRMNREETVEDFEPSVSIETRPGSLPDVAGVDKVFAEQVSRICHHKYRTGPNHIKKQLSIVFSRLIDDLSYAEIAEKFNITVNYTYQQYYRGLKVLEQNQRFRELL